MSRRMAAWGRRERLRLLAVLGGQCTACGRTEDLEFDCIEPTGHRHHRMNTASKMCFYRKQMARGNIQLLCTVCNVLKGDMPKDAWLNWLTIRREKLFYYTRIKAGELSGQLSSLLARKDFDEVSL